MDETMTPSQKRMTQRQINKAVDNYRALLEKHVPEFESAAVQIVLGQSEFAEAQLALFRERVEAITGRVLAPNGVVMPEGTVVRRVRVDGTRPPREVVDGTGRKQYINNDVLATLPPSDSGEMDVYFVPTRKYVPVNEAGVFLAQFGLVFNPRAQAAANEGDPSLADTVPNGTQWGKNCYLTFHRWRGGRVVNCDRGGFGWFGIWFLSGVPAPRK